MATIVTQRQLRKDSADIMRRLDAGVTFVLTRDGVPVGEVTPLRQQQFTSRDDVMRLFSDFPASDYQRLRDDLDSAADQTVEPRG